MGSGLSEEQYRALIDLGLLDFLQQAASRNALPALLAPLLPMTAEMNLETSFHRNPSPATFESSVVDISGCPDFSYLKLPPPPILPRAHCDTISGAAVNTPLSPTTDSPTSDGEPEILGPTKRKRRSDRSALAEIPGSKRRLVAAGSSGSGLIPGSGDAPMAQDPTCNRGGRVAHSNWQVSATQAQIRDAKALDFLSSLVSSLSSDFQAPAGPGWVEGLKDSIQQTSLNLEAFVDNSIFSIAKRCCQGEATYASATFAHMVSNIQLVISENHIRANNSQLRSSRDVWKKYLEDSYDNKLPGVPGQTNFCKFITSGTKLSQLAAAGSIYTLMIVAARSILPGFLNLDPKSVRVLCENIKNPDPDTDMGKHIIKHLIPAVAHLRQVLPVTFATIFPFATLRQLNFPEEIQCIDLDQSDRFFNYVKKNDFNSGKRGHYWSSCSNMSIGNRPLSLYPFHKDMITRTCSRAPSSEEYYSTFDDTPLSPLPSEYEDDNAVTDDELAPPLEIISIGLNLKSTSNKKKPFPSDREERIVFTAAEMEKAENAEDLNNWSDFCHRLGTFYANGNKTDGSYIRVKNEYFTQKEFQLVDEHGSLVAYLAGDMPESIRSDLESSIRAALSLEPGTENLVDLDSRKAGSQGVGPTFPAYHFAYYSRSGPKADGAPLNTHPHSLVREGKTKLNIGQLVPCLAKDAQDHYNVYQNLSRSLQPMFEWIAGRIHSRFPNEFDELQLAADILPARENSPAYPFCGFVLNINGITKVHRDPHDFRHFCVVVVVGEHQGGELCLLEPGLVLELKSGDMVIFQSGLISHFNLHYSGVRASVVLNTDAAIYQYASNNMNGWGANQHMSSFESK